MVDVIPLLEISESVRQELVSRLTDETIENWLASSVADAIASREDFDRQGKDLHLVVLQDGVPMGWTGWRHYPPHPNWVETTTYLAKEARGSGINTKLKGLLWQVADAAQVTLVASPHEDNEQSQLALMRLWPHLKWNRVWDDSKQRWSQCALLDEPPDPFVRWSEELVQELVDRVRSIPAVNN